MRIKLDRDNIIDGVLWSQGTPIAPQDILTVGVRFDYHRTETDVICGLTVVDSTNKETLRCEDPIGMAFHSEWRDLVLESIDYNV
jgi:hypothetical protein